MARTKKNSKKQSTTTDLSPAKLAQKARTELLDMAQKWSQQDYSTNFSLSIYKYLIANYPESSEAAQARQGMLEIAKSWNNQGRRYSALDLYKNLIKQTYE